ncbi:MAG: hypothetical protein ABJA78_20060 [Ferruginibacter sp.]
MKKNIVFYLLISFCSFTLVSCNNDKATVDLTKTSIRDTTKKESPASNTSIELQAPDFTDAALTKYFSSYTAYLKKVVTAIRNRDEATTMKLFAEEGKQFNNRNKMEQKARSTTEEEQKFTIWLMQSMPYQTEIINSDYYKKYNEKYYKR